MAEYTPTMTNVRTSFAEAWAAEVMSDDADWIQDYEQGLVAFDRAIAAHDRAVEKRGAVKALRSMARVVRDESEEGFIYVPTVGLFPVDEYLTRTTDQIEGGH